MARLEGYRHPGRRGVRAIRMRTAVWTHYVPPIGAAQAAAQASSGRSVGPRLGSFFAKLASVLGLGPKAPS